MSKRVYKYYLPLPCSSYDIELPQGFKVLKVAVQHGSPVAWVAVDVSAPMTKVLASTYETGDEISEADEYWGTYVLQESDTVWHVFSEASK